MLTANNTFTGNQAVTGNLTASAAVTAGTVNAVNSFGLGDYLFAFGNAKYGNAFLGFAGASSSTGYDNTAVGVEALYANTTENENTASGSSALFSNTTGYKGSPQEREIYVR